MILQGKELYNLIPQRPPTVMVGVLWNAEAGSATTGLVVEPSNIFVSEGQLREAGIIEHIAQSAAAMEGYKTYKEGLPPFLGFIGEIKKCRIYSLPNVGDELRTEIHVLGEVVGVTLVEAKTYIAGAGDTRQVAECQMKIFIKK